jgi:exonuclease I
VFPDITEEATVKITKIPDIYVEISDADAPVRAALIANGITPMICQEKGKKEQKDFIENKKRLAAYVKERGKTLVFITSST